MSARCTVLMYHATPLNEAEVGSADPHYSVALGVYEQHLDLMQTLGYTARAVERVEASILKGERPIGMTFDDGHVTNIHAAKALARRGWCGTFFVNPGTVGTADYLSWSQLRDMADMGMSIQSHAQHHRYQDELSRADQWADLSQSKSEIEQHLGHPVTVYAPPGGRVSPLTTDLAKQAGYTMVSTSRVGVWHVQTDPVWDVPRFAVLGTTPLSQLQAWATQAPVEVTKQVVRYRLLRSAKRLLGNGGYERLRSAVLGAPKEY